MGDWLMENGDRSSHSGDFAYDTDNDAWVPMGDSPGSTPVWWRKYGNGGNASNPARQRRQLTREECEEKIALDKQRQIEQRVLKSYKKQLEDCSSDKYIERVKSNSTGMTMFFAMPLSFIILCFLGAAFGVPENGATVAIIVILVIVVITACSFALLSRSGSNDANKKIAEAKKRVSDQEQVLADIKKKLDSYY